MQRKEELMKREAERLTQLKREQRDAERRRQAEETARARETEKARRAAAIAAAIAEEDDGDSAAGLPAAEATPAVPARKTSDATPPARPEAGSAKPAPPPTRSRPELSHNRSADDQPPAPKPLMAVQGPATADRKDTPVPVRKAPAEAQALEPAKPRAPAVSPRKFATPSKGVQFAKGYQENGVTPPLLFRSFPALSGVGRLTPDFHTGAGRVVQAHAERGDVLVCPDADRQRGSAGAAGGAQADRRGVQSGEAKVDRSRLRAQGLVDLEESREAQGCATFSSHRYS
jgi:hypothetical protein